jgi:hypothetical protein
VAQTLISETQTKGNGKMSTRDIANRLSKQQRDCLIQHIDYPQPIKRGPEFQTAFCLMYRNLLRGDYPQFPRSTSLTELGREVLCTVLGDYADALFRTHLIEIETSAEPILPPHIQAAINSAFQPPKSKLRDKLIERLCSANAEAKKELILATEKL